MCQTRQRLIVNRYYISRIMGTLRVSVCVRARFLSYRFVEIGFTARPSNKIYYALLHWRFKIYDNFNTITMNVNWRYVSKYNWTMLRCHKLRGTSIGVIPNSNGFYKFCYSHAREQRNLKNVSNSVAEFIGPYYLIVRSNQMLIKIRRAGSIWTIAVPSMHAWNRCAR